MSEISQSLISNRLKLFNPLKDERLNSDLLLLISNHLKRGTSAKGEKSEIFVFHARIPSKLCNPESGETSDIGLPSIPSPFSFISSASGDKSRMSFSSRPSQSTLIKPARGDTSVILFPRSLMLLSRVNPANGVRSEISLRRNSIRSRRVACSRPRRSRIPLSSAISIVNLVVMSSVVIEAGDLPSLSAIAVRRFTSGTG